MSEQRISLIIPAYNEERYLRGCLELVKKQTLKPFEVIVVDNNSTDKTAAIAAKYDFVTVVRESQQGRVYAQTTGFNRARGELIARIDADTHLPANWVQELAVIAARKPQVAAFTGCGAFYDAPWPRFLGWVQVLIYQLLQWPAMRSATLWGATMAIRREAWERSKNHCHRRTDIDEDIDLTLQLRRQGLKVKFVPRLQSEMSLRRDQTGPRVVAQYLATWPLDYVVNGRYFAAGYIAMLTGFTFVLTTIGWLVASAKHKMAKRWMAFLVYNKQRS